MRLAFSGSHGSGKTTLVEALAELLPAYDSVPEPYHQLLDAGHGFQDPPSREDFEAQLELALDTLAASGPDTLFDRCPLDLVAYLRCHPEGFEAAWLPRLHQVMAQLDLVFFLPLAEAPVPAGPQDAAYRKAVDETLRELLLADELGLELRVVELGGELPARIAAVRACLAG